MLEPELLWITLLSFIADSAFLALYFSHVLSDYTSKHSPRTGAILLSFLGSGVGAAFSLVVPLLPDILPYMDVAVALIVVTWILLLHYRYEAGWLEAIFATAIAAIIYVVILGITVGFYVLWSRTS